MTTDTIRLRSEFINTKVITNNSARQLGVVKEVLVDIDRREVVAFGLRDNLISVAGMPKYMYLSSVEKTGDVILVPDEDVIEDVEVEAYSKLIGSEVITETGELLGRVRDFQFNLEDGRVSSLIIASIGIPQIPDQAISTYELRVEEIVSSGPNRIIVFEGCEERITQITVGILERLGIGRPLWERDEDDLYGYPSAAPPENQLPTGIPVNPPPPQAEIRPPVWDEDEWEEAEPVPLPRREVERVRYQEYEPEEYEEDNWSEPEPPRYEQSAYVEPEPPPYRYEDSNQDVWDDDVKPEPYNPPRVNFPEKTKAPEYEDGY